MHSACDNHSEPVSSVFNGLPTSFDPSDTTVSLIAFKNKSGHLQNSCFIGHLSEMHAATTHRAGC